MRLLRAIALPLAQHALTLATTALLVIVATRFILSHVSLQNQVLNLLISEAGTPYRQLSASAVLAESLARSAVLLLAALGGAALAGMAAALVFVRARSAFVRAAAWGAGTVGVTLPSFFWAMLLQLAVILFYGRTGAQSLPTSGYGLDAHLILPAIALGARPAAYLFRTAATALDEVEHAEYLRAARAKGLDEPVILVRHALPNAAPALLGGLGLAARSALSSLAIVEYVFRWYGAGYGFIYAVAKGNVALASAIGAAFAVLFALVNVAVAWGSRAFDPRLARR